LPILDEGIPGFDRQGYSGRRCQFCRAGEIIDESVSQEQQRAFLFQSCTYEQTLKKQIPPVGIDLSDTKEVKEAIAGAAREVIDAGQAAAPSGGAGVSIAARVRRRLGSLSFGKEPQAPGPLRAPFESAFGQ